MPERAAIFSCFLFCSFGNRAKKDREVFTKVINMAQFVAFYQLVLNPSHPFSFLCCSHRRKCQSLGPCARVTYSLFFFIVSAAREIHCSRFRTERRGRIVCTFKFPTLPLILGPSVNAELSY